ncbi:MAG: ElyC/SanA/YdcF family protein [Gemmatimonadota bacterium]|nr:ElyC/SanA/YdcF family protein [Gemmatimonadota bacterium]
MITGEDIICFSSIDWDFNWQGHQEIMRTLASGGNRVIFIENTGVRTPRLRDYNRLLRRIHNWWAGFKGIRQVEKNLFVFSPIVLPFPYSRLARRINRWLILRVLNPWCRSTRFASPLAWTFLPSPLTREVIERLPAKLLIYYCIDSFEHSSLGAARIREHESRMIKRADLVFVTSELLRKHCLEHNQEVYKFPFTVDFEPFDRVRTAPFPELPDDMAGIEKPVVGYVGGLHRWVDQDLLVELATMMPECSFVFVGPEQEEVGRLRSLPNVHLLGGKPHCRLPFYLRHFDVGLIPYLKTDYTDNVYPTKLNEYMAMGLPVVSTAISEIQWFDREEPDLVDVCTGAGQMAGAIRRRLAETGQPGSEQIRSRRVDLARRNSWPVRIEKMSELICERISQVRAGAERDWRSRLGEVLTVSRNKALALAAAALVIYTAIFWSPLVFLMGRPLVIEQEPVASDVILVFGGGVGETGRPGTSTLERGHFAAELYQRGMGRKVIFSSGYQQKRRKDVENMSQIARADGVPARDILVEGNSANNYENVAFCLAVMDSLGYTSAVVVSSPYNMLRTALVFDKFAEQGALERDRLRMVPVENPIFFFRPMSEGDRMEQWKAIFHEYAAIAYYWWTGRI